jgi:arsenite methyltransferase
MTIRKNVEQELDFLDMQAEIGITKHIGGFSATNELLSLCHIDTAHEVLYVGCGIGIGPAFIAKKYGCHVVGVDISGKMVDWSRKRAKMERVADQVEVQIANVLDLPFETGRFDLVVSESVLIFVDDKPRAIEECVRVTRPGGSVGINEAYWTKDPTPEMVASVSSALGPCIPTLQGWQALWSGSGLQDQIFRTYLIDNRQEIRGRIRWIGWRWLLPAWGRALRLYFSNPAIRQSIKRTFDLPYETYQSIGYVLLAGRK